MGKTSGEKKSKAPKKAVAVKEAAKKPRRPYARYQKRDHASLIRARVLIPSAKGREVDTFLNELLHRELNTAQLIAMLQATLYKRTRVTLKDQRYGLRSSNTAFGEFV